MQIHGADDRGQEHQELHVGVRVRARIKKIDARTRGHGPVVVLATSIDACERLLMDQALKSVLASHHAQHLHGDHLMVNGDVGILKHRRQFVLTWSNLVVTGLGWNAQLKEPCFYFCHEGQYAVWNCAKVMVIQLMALGRIGAHHGSASHHQVEALLGLLALNQEILLLATKGAHHVGDASVVTKDLENAHRLLGKRLNGAQERGLLVERFAGPTDERGGDAQGGDARRIAQEERRAGGVPSGVAARFVGIADSARRETGCIGFADHQLIAGELFDGAAIGHWIEERVVLLSSDAGQWLEPVAIVRGTVFDRPVLHGNGNRVGNCWVKRCALTHGALQLCKDVTWQALQHGVAAEGHAAEVVGGARWVVER